MPARYRDLNTHLRALFGCRVQKISVDAGLTCPNRDGRVGSGGCIYCNSRGSGTGAHRLGLSVAEQLRRGKAALSKRYKAEKFLAYFQSFCNTYAPLETLHRLYAEALGVPNVVGLAVGTRPDCVDAPVLDLLAGLARSHLIWVEYGLQSAHDATLARINRGHTFRQFQRAVQATRHRGIRICAHVILGLPGETRRQMLVTADAVAALGIDGIKLHLLYVIRGTPLEVLYRTGHYTCLEQAAYVDLVCDFLERLPPEMVIQRLTGDPHPEELVAPQWSLKKSETLSLIQASLEQRDAWQGQKFQEKQAPPQAP
ncbi:MAG: TIGR01212 family radical SAM protein [Desulfobacterales bacterium]